MRKKFCCVIHKFKFKFKLVALRMIHGEMMKIESKVKATAVERDMKTKPLSRNV